MKWEKYKIGVFIKIDRQTGKAFHIERIRVKESEVKDKELQSG